MTRLGLAVEVYDRRCCQQFRVRAFERIDIENIQQSLTQTEKTVDHLLETMRNHLYMDTDRVFSRAGITCYCEVFD